MPAVWVCDACERTVGPVRSVYCRCGASAWSCVWEADDAPLWPVRLSDLCPVSAVVGGTVALVAITLILLVLIISRG